MKVKEIINSIPSDVTIVAATKYVDTTKMEKLYESGITNFGENRVDAFLKKHEKLSHLNVKWHFIGHLQKNKAKKIINYIDILHSLDSLELAKLIDKFRVNPIDCFIEINLTDSKTKNGIKLVDLNNFLIEIKKYDKINILGFMAMTEPDYSDEEKMRLFKKVKEIADIYGYKNLSMGMSDDYKIAIEAKATHIRLGRILVLEE